HLGQVEFVSPGESPASLVDRLIANDPAADARGLPGAPRRRGIRPWQLIRVERYMSGRITRAIIESFLKCKTKARLMGQGEQGVPSDYEMFLREKRDDVRRRAIEGILSKHEDQQALIVRDLPATIPLLKQGADYVFDSRVEDQTVSISFDAL